jgi:class 3 adenylate cyclase/predicted ATPase
LDIDGWLRSLGLGQYEAAFRDNAIDEKVLPRLTAEDLKDLGVGLVGHRRMLLDAIAALGGDANAKEPLSEALLQVPALAQASAPPPTAAPAAEAVGERRYLTVMFCDLVGSTGIAAQLDAEEWRDLVGSYLDAASAAVTEMGGHVAKKLGDGLMSLFGYPVAQENDAERATQAALAIQRALAELNRKNAGTGKPELVARIGLDTGSAVVDAAGEIYGDVANVAARVQALAEPGAVLVTARVQRQTAGLFVAEERGTHTLKGVPEPTALFRLVRASGGGRRSAQRNLTPLVGRDDEITMLTRRWERARQGDGQLVLIVGEPGLGKSRLIEEFHARLADTPHTWVEWSCSQLLQNTPLHPIAEWGRQRFGGADVPAERRLADLESSLAQVKLDPAENIPLLAPLLDIPLPKERAPALAPEELRRRQLAALSNWVIAGATVQPVVLAFEDLHWADPTTLDVLRGIAERGALAPLFIVATTRPEFRPPWSMRSHHGTISLAPLDRLQVREMVAELAAHHALPREVVEDVAARTGGVPLFVEEVTRLLLERGEQGGGIQAIPPTLQQSLAARLDRLGSAREVAQIGSVIGRGFSYGLLRDVAGMEDAALQGTLERLAEADIFLVQGTPPGSDYRFKHALIQDAAYENLLKSRRLVLHRRVAEILRDRFADTAAAEPEALAYHFTQAGLTEAAIEWWGKAGDQALRRSAFQEAISHLRKAIEMADKLAEAAPAEGPRGDGRVRLQTAYGNALIAARGHGAPETTAAFTRAAELAAGSEEAAERFSARYGLWTGNYVRGELELVRELSAAFLRDAERQPNSPEVLVGHRIVGISHFVEGDYIGALAHLEQALASYDAERHRPLTFRYGVDSRVSCLVYLAYTLWPLGEIARARRLADEALAYAQSTGHLATVAYALGHVCELDLLWHDTGRLLQHAKSLVALSREHGLQMWLALSTFELGYARWRTGERDAGDTDMRLGMGMLKEQGVMVRRTLFESAHAQAQAEMNHVDVALGMLDDAFAQCQRSGHWNLAELHRIRGDILLKGDPANTTPAEEAFLTAIAVAQQQKARSFELRAALALAKLYQSTNRTADAHAVLTPALEGFSSTPEFPEIEEAQTLLVALTQTDQVRNSAASRQRRLKLQTSFGNALIAARGHGAPETTAAFARAQELAAAVDDPMERLSANYGLWVGHFSRGEVGPMRAIAEIVLRDIEGKPPSPEAAVTHRLAGVTDWYLGNFELARAHLEQTLAMFDPQRDRDLTYRFGQDMGVSVMAFIALARWTLGETDQARRVNEEMLARAVASGHMLTTVFAHFQYALFHVVRRDAAATAPLAEAVVKLAREHGMPLYSAYGEFLQPWARWHLGDREGGLAAMRRGIAACHNIGNALFTTLFETALAEAEAEAGEIEAALASIDHAVALTERTGQHWSEADTQRARGEILSKRDPANPAPAEEALLTAIAIAQQQKAKSFELRAALSLAKLYQSTDRAAEAHAVLASALEGFSPTPEFPEIAEAKALLAAIAPTDEVKSAATARQRRLQLQTSYGQALLWSKGFSADETEAAFTRARELAAGSKDAGGRFATHYGLWIGSLMRGELRRSRESAETFLREAESGAWLTEVGVARRNLGMTCLFQGDFADAKAQLEQALRTYDPERDRDAKFRFGVDSGVGAAVYLALTIWLLGEVDRARQLIDEAVAHADESAHPPTLAIVHNFKAVLELLRGDGAAAKRHGDRAVELSREHGLGFFLNAAGQASSAAGARSGERGAAAVESRRLTATYVAEGNKFLVPFYEGLLAEIEAELDDLDEALNRIDAALAVADETGEHWTDAFMHRIRGEILLKRDPANTAQAEEAFLTAIAVARQQKARSFELRAAVSMARLWRDQGKRDETRELLAPVYGWFTEGFDTMDLKDAKALLDELRA